MSHKPVRKAVIAAAGFGTRFLPQTKAMPKEMLPLVDKPIIQYVVEELVSVGIEDIIIVTGYHKRSIEDHFDQISADLAINLQQGKKQRLLEDTKKISEMANFAYVRQKGPYGNGTPVLNVEHLIGDEPFIFTWSDDFIVASPPRFQQMIDVYEQYGASVLSAVRVKHDADYDSYGIAGGEKIADGIIKVQQLIEKPGKDKAPSDLATVSGYLLTSDVFAYLHTALQNLSEDEELYSNNALKLMVKDGHTILATEIKDGKYYDAGNKLEYVKTVVDFALQHDDIKEEFAQYLRNIVQ